MKRPGKIFLSFLLSLMLVYLGTGIVIMQCCHDGMMLAQQTKMCCQQKGQHGKDHSCKKVTVLKLSPTVKAQQVSVRLTNIAFALPVFQYLSQELLLVPRPTQASYEEHIPPPTPREYLTRLNILII